MKIASLVTDNITELLVKIIKFTQTRHKILARNISNIGTLGFVPKDLVADEFSGLLNSAIDEHITNRRLLLRDTDNIKFGIGGSFEVKATVDEYAKELIDKNRDEYIELQLNKLLENTLNQRVAAELLRKKQGITAIFEYGFGE